MDEMAGLRARAHAAEVDLNYTMYFPLEQTYVGLYADKGKEKAGAEAAAAAVRKSPMWSVVEEAMAQGKLEDLREGRWDPRSGDVPSGDARDEPGQTVSAPQSKKRAAQGRSTSYTRKKAGRRKDAGERGRSSGSDNEDGGAFFE